MSATIEPWKAPIAAQAPTAMRIASQPGTSCDDATMRHLRHDDAAHAGDVADREVDLADQEDEDDAVGEHRDAGHLRDDVREVAAP